MNKTRFVEVHIRRGYEVEVLGNLVILRHENYTAIWCFNADGTLNEKYPPEWWVRNPQTE